MDVNNGDGSRVSAVEDGTKVSSVFEPALKKRSGQWFMIGFLMILFVVSTACVGWLYVENRAMSQAKEQLVKQNYSAVTRIEATGQSIRSYEEMISMLSSENALLEDQNAGFAGVERLLRLEIAELEGAIAGYKNQIAGLKMNRSPYKDNDALSSLNASLVSENEELAGKVAILSDQVNKASRVYRQRLIELQGKNDRITAENISLLGKNAQLIGRYGEIAAEKTILFEENVSLAAENESVISENSDLSEKIAEVDVLNAELFSENEKLSEKNNILLSQKLELAEVTKEITVENVALTKKNARLAAQKAVPVIKKPDVLVKGTVADMLASVEPEGKSRFVASEKKRSKSAAKE